MNLKSLCGLAVVSSLFSTFLIAADNVPAPSARIALFDGKNFDAWDVIKCEAVVTNDNILLKAGNGIVQTKNKYSDFVLEYEWKALRENKWDSGVYFRYDPIPTNSPWPSRYQANLKENQEGNLVDFKNGTSTGLFKDGEWNSFKLTVRGTAAEMEINGKPAWKVDGLEGPKTSFIGLQAEVPGGGQCLFRNIYITELK